MCDSFDFVASGLVSGYTMGGVIHVLLVIAIIVVVVRLIQGRKILVASRYPWASRWHFSKYKLYLTPCGRVRIHPRPGRGTLPPGY